MKPSPFFQRKIKVTTRWKMKRCRLYGLWGWTPGVTPASFLPTQAFFMIKIARLFNLFCFVFLIFSCDIYSDFISRTRSSTMVLTLPEEAQFRWTFLVCILTTFRFEKLEVLFNLENSPSNTSSTCVTEKGHLKVPERCIHINEGFNCRMYLSWKFVVATNSIHFLFKASRHISQQHLYRFLTARMQHFISGFVLFLILWNPGCCFIQDAIPTPVLVVT